MAAETTPLQRNQQRVQFLRDVQKVERFADDDEGYADDAAVIRHFNDVWARIKKVSDAVDRAAEAEETDESAGLLFPRRWSISWNRLHTLAFGAGTNAPKTTGPVARSAWVAFGNARNMRKRQDRPFRKGIRTDGRLAHNKRIKNLFDHDVVGEESIASFASVAGTSAHVRAMYRVLDAGPCHQINFPYDADANVQRGDPAWKAFSGYAEADNAKINNRDNELGDNLYKALLTKANYAIVGVEMMVFDPYRLYYAQDDSDDAYVFQSRVDFVARRADGDNPRHLIVGDYKTRWGNQTQDKFDGAREWRQVLVNAFFVQLIYGLRVTHVALVTANLNDDVVVMERVFGGPFARRTLHQLMWVPRSLYTDANVTIEHLHRWHALPADKETWEADMASRAVRNIVMQVADTVPQSDDYAVARAEMPFHLRRLYGDDTAAFVNDITLADSKLKSAGAPGVNGHKYAGGPHAAKTVVYTAKKLKAALIGAEFLADWKAVTMDERRGKVPVKAADVFRVKDGAQSFPRRVTPAAATVPPHRDVRVETERAFARACGVIAEMIPRELSAYTLLYSSTRNMRDVFGADTARKERWLEWRASWKGLRGEIAAALGYDAARRAKVARWTAERAGKWTNDDGDPITNIVPWDSRRQSLDAFVAAWIVSPRPQTPWIDHVTMHSTPTVRREQLDAVPQHEKRALAMMLCRKRLMSDKVTAVVRTAQWFLNCEHVATNTNLESFLGQRTTTTPATFASLSQRAFWRNRADIRGGDARDLKKEATRARSEILRAVQSAVVKAAATFRRVRAA